MDMSIRYRMVMVEEKNRQRLTADDWARVALSAIGEGGLAAVSVERLAARLGATKGSFYWHFTNRDALLEAALSLWNREHTEAVIARVEGETDARSKLRRLLVEVTGDATETAENRIEVALLATATHPLVAPTVGRITERRIGYVAELYEQLGSAPEDARRHALLAFTAWLGYLQLAHAAPGVLPRDEQAGRYLDYMLETVTNPA